MNKVRITASFAAFAALLAVMAGTAGAATGGNPASAVPAGCAFSRGVTACTTTASTPGTPTVTTVPSTFTSTSGPAYDLEYAVNIPDCTPGAPVVRGWDTTTTTPSSVTTTTTAHHGAPGSRGEELPTQTITVAGPVTTTTSTTKPASPGTVTVASTAASAVFTGLTPNAPYGLGVRCLGNAVTFWTDGTGAATVTLDVSRFAGQQIQLEMFAQPNDWFGPGFAVTAPYTPVASRRQYGTAELRVPLDAPLGRAVHRVGPGAGGQSALASQGTRQRSRGELDAAPADRADVESGLGCGIPARGVASVGTSRQLFRPKSRGMLHPALPTPRASGGPAHWLSPATTGEVPLPGLLVRERRRSLSGTRNRHSGSPS